MQRHIIGSMTLELCRLIIQLDRLFLCQLDGWLPVHKAEYELIRPKKIHGNTKEAHLKMMPEIWPMESEIFCRLSKIGSLWNLYEVTIKAPHVHTEIGGINIILPVINGQIMLPDEIGSPNSDVISNIIITSRRERQ